jgi:hypothetical protein
MLHAGFFIVGAPRTGSTLLRRILNAHSDVAIPPESPFLIDYLTAEQVPTARRLDLLVRDPDYRAWRQGVTSELQATDVPSGVAEIHALYAAAVGKSRWGHKTPRFVRHWERLARWFPGARFIHLARDPRAVAASLRGSAAHRSHALAAAQRWRLDTAHGLEMERALGSRAWRVHYEDIVRRPEATVQQVCQFLDLTFDPAMLRPGSELQLTAHEGMTHHHDRVGQAIDTSSLESWRQTLSPADLAVVNAVVSPVSRSCGYEILPAPGPSAWQRAKYHFDGQTMAVVKLLRDLQQRRPLWHVCRRRWQLGTFWSSAADYLAGR